MDTGATDVYSMAGCCSHVGTALDFFFFFLIVKVKLCGSTGDS